MSLRITKCHNYLLCLLFFNVTSINTQFMPLSRKAKTNACDNPNKSALVEQFFNVIFNEFHNPPVCVCVQMCANMPTYCYPNGCLKRAETKKKTADETQTTPEMNIQNVVAANTMFLVNEKDDLARFLNDNDDGGKTPTEKSTVKDMRPDPFKDRYKMLFKYKKMPKVELRYNLREQVKNMKSDILRVEIKDVSKTRWPNGNYMVSNEQQVFKANEKKNEKHSADGNVKILVSNTNSGTNNEGYTSKYFKRDLRKKEDSDVEGEDLPEKDDPLDNKHFSIETLIENLIGNNFEEKRDTDTESHTEWNDSNNNSSRDIPTTENFFDSKVTNDTDDITCVVSMNMTNQNLDENKYIEGSLARERIEKWKNFTFNEMITALAKRIEKQNNTSMELMQQASRNNVEVIIENATKSSEAEENLKTAENTTLHKSLSDEIQTVIISNQSVNVNTTRDSHRKQIQTE